MIELLNRTNELFGATICCHNDPAHPCHCITCLQGGFYGEPDTYNCIKKLCSYVMNYGPCYSSEMFHFLSADHLLENNYNNSQMNILSLGCGFCPDWFGINKYISDKRLTITYNYRGIDSQELWSQLREGVSNATYQYFDLLNGFNLSGFDLIIVNKLFSTLQSIDQHNIFLAILVREIQNSMAVGSHLIFNDANHQNKGRDIFDNAIQQYFREIRRYKFNIDNPYGRQYININSINNVFVYPNNLAIIPKPTVTKAVVFVYRK